MSAARTRTPSLPPSPTVLVLVDFINPLDFDGAESLAPPAWPLVRANTMQSVDMCIPVVHIMQRPRCVSNPAAAALGTRVAAIGLPAAFAWRRTMEHKTPPRRSTKKPVSPSVAGEEDPGAALDSGDAAAPGTPSTGEAVCHRCGGSGKFGGSPCPTCGGTGKVVQGIGGG